MDTSETLLAFHRVERNVYRRMIDMGIDTEIARRVMAFWLWLEATGHYDIVKNISSHNDRFLALVAVEAEAALACVLSDRISPTTYIHMPITSNISNYSFSLNYFCLNKENISRAVSHILDGICSLIFRDILEERGIQIEVTGASPVRRQGLNPDAPSSTLRVVPGQQMGMGTGSSSARFPSASLVGELARPAAFRVRSTLSPLARPWYPELEQVSEDKRGLYFTFSKGHPLTENEIFGFFTSKYGDCVEEVYVHQPEAGKGAALFGKVLFRSHLVLALVMRGEEKMKYIVEGKALWCRKFKPKNHHGHGRIREI